jgi:hypothetical protein
MKGLDAQGRLTGDFVCNGIIPEFAPRAEYFGRDQELMDCFRS